MQIDRQFVECIDVGDRLRAVNPDKVMQIAESMKSIGLINPVCVKYSDDGGTCTLVAGAHRLAAAKHLGWDSIDTVEIVGGDLTAQLAEIDENLCRSELTPAQYASHIHRRKQVWEAMRAAEANSGNSVSTIPEPRGRGRPEEFASDTAKATGVSKQSVNQHSARAEALGDDIDEVVGTSLDKGVELDALKSLPVDERRELIDRAKSGENVSAREMAPDRDRLRRLVVQSINEVAKLANYGTADDIEAVAREAGVSEQAREYLSALLSAAIQRRAAA